MRPTPDCGGQRPSRQERLRTIVADGLQRRRRRRRQRIAASALVAVVVAAATTRAFDAPSVQPVRVDTAATHTGEGEPLGAVSLHQTSVAAAIDIAQEFATALADEDWLRATQLSPTLPGAPDGLSNTYGAIETYKIIPIDATVSLPLVTLRIATISQVGTDIPMSRWTWANCATWEVDLSTTTLRELQVDDADFHLVRESVNKWPVFEGWIDPESLIDEAQSECRVDEIPLGPYE